MSATTPTIQRRITAPASAKGVYEHFYEAGWTDGLPIIGPTEGLVEEMVAASGRPRDEVIGVIPPLYGEATVETVAINAVMAGCKPEYMPLILASLRAILEPWFNLEGSTTSLGPWAPLLVVNGPIAKRLEINGRHNCFGPGFRANATIGRAISLLLINAGGMKPGVSTMSTTGSPARYTYCIAENEEENEWEPLHVSRGMPPGSSAVTAINCGTFYLHSDQSSTDGKGVLEFTSAVLRTPGNEGFSSAGPGRDYHILMLFPPERVRLLARDGISRKDVQEYLFNNARMKIRDVRGRGYWAARTLPVWANENDPETLLPMVPKPENIVILVAGSDTGRHLLWFRTWDMHTPVTVPVEEPR